MILGEKIKSIRKSFGFTQEELAEKLNVSRQAIAKWEMEGGMPDTENLKALSKLFGVSIVSLLDNDADMPLAVLHQEINIRDFGKGINEQQKNVINKNFDKNWKVYMLSSDVKPFSVEDIVETLTTGLSELPNVIKAFKEFHYLAVKDNYKLFVTVTKNMIDIKTLPSNIDIKKFELDNRIYTSISELARD